MTKNFQLSEFACNDGTPVPAELVPNVEKLAVQLQVLRDELGEGIHILSGYRTPSWNKKVGGKAKSQHLQAKAADIITPTKTPKQLKAVIEKLIKQGKMKDGGIGLYPSFVHYDIGPVRRW
jgi:uncharacterized protein YcbK (DUF882 family)